MNSLLLVTKNKKSLPNLRPFLFCSLDSFFLLLLLYLKAAKYTIVLPPPNGAICSLLSSNELVLEGPEGPTLVHIHLNRNQLLNEQASSWTSGYGMLRGSECSLEASVQVNTCRGRNAGINYNLIIARKRGWASRFLKNAFSLQITQWQWIWPSSSKIILINISPVDSIVVHFSRIYSRMRLPIWRLSWVKKDKLIKY